MISRTRKLSRTSGVRSLSKTAFVAAMALSLVLALASGGCNSQPKAPPAPPTTKVLKLQHRMGGTHHCALVRGDVWYQTFGETLLVLDSAMGAKVTELSLGEAGRTGPAIDMLAHGDRLYVVIEDDAVVVLDIASPRSPMLLTKVQRDQLGVRPRRLSAVDGDVFVSGLGGVVKLPDIDVLRAFVAAAESAAAAAQNPKSSRGKGSASPETPLVLPKTVTCIDDAGRIARSAEGLVVPVNRSVFRVEDHQFVGAATDLHMVGPDAGLPEGADLIFVRQDQAGALIGLMKGNVRELDANNSTIAVAGQLRSVRAFGGRVWVVNDLEAIAYTMQDGRLKPDVRIDVKGARDVAPIDDNHIAIAGSQGRAIYRIKKDAKGEGGEFINPHREPSRLSRAASDGRNILAGSIEGAWMYMINSRVEQTTRLLDKLPAPQRAVAVAREVGAPPASAAGASGGGGGVSDGGGGGEARISEDGASLSVKRGASELLWSEPVGAKLHCLEIIDGDLWVGHERGISVLRLNASPQVLGDPCIATLRIEGPVLYIYPLLVGGGAAFVSEFGGFGVVQFVDEPVGGAVAPKP